MSQILKIATVTVIAAALAACGNTGPAPTSDPETPIPAASTDSAASTEVAVPLVEPTQQNLPGVYAGRLPCGDCAAVVTKLELSGDGTYKVNEVFEGKPGGATLDSDGTWTFDVATRRVTLDPTAQDWQDRVFEAVNTGALRPIDARGVAYSSEGVNDLTIAR